MKKIVPVAAWCLFLLTSCSQKLQVPYVPNEESAIMSHLEVLTSDAFEGREAGKLGGARAAAYIKSQFHSLNLLPPVDSSGVKSYYQYVPIVSRWRKQTTDTSPLGENVLGLIEGLEHPEEVVIITAHYDHLGKRNNKIYRGADDNGSGVAALLEIAKYFQAAVAKGDRPKRSILLIALTGEEKGLLGSAHYVNVDPVFPLKNTVTNLNMDMVGHLDDLHTEDPNFVTVVGSDWQSTELHEIHETVNEKYVNLALDYSFNAKDHPERFFYRSDQYHFAKNGIPVIFYTSGDHNDYHKASDTMENIQLERIEKVAKLVFHTAWEVANRKQRIKVDKTLD